MATAETTQHETREQKAIGWIINAGLVWTLSMAWCAQRWPDQSFYILVAAAIGATTAMGFAAYRARQRAEPAMRSEPDVPEIRVASADVELQPSGKERIARLENVGLQHVAEAFRHHVRSERHSVEQMDFENLLNQVAEVRVRELQSAMLADMLTYRRAHHLTIRHNRRTPPVLNMIPEVGKSYILDFGTVTVEISGDDAKIDLSRASNVKMVRPVSASPQVGGEQDVLVGLKDNRGVLH